ncbi:MAG: hypothetical protein WCJ30_06705 [Deltaproteobacteria bacterium]
MTAAERPSPPALLAFVLGALVGGAGMSIGLGSGGGQRARATPRATEGALPSDPAAFVPSGVRGVIVADVGRLRAAPALAALFGAPVAGEPCEAALLRRVRRIAVAVGGSLDEIGVAFAGDLSGDALLTCARTRMAPGSTMERATYRGVELTRLAPARSRELLPPSNVSEIVYLRGGVVLAGTSGMVRRMIDRGLSPGGDDTVTAGSELQRRIGAGFDATGVAELPSGAGGASGASDELLDPAMVHVRGVAAGVRVSDHVEVTALLACDDFDSPRAVADASTRLRDGLAAQLRLPALAEPLRRAQIERRATDVRITTTVNADEIDALATVLRALLAPPPEAQTSSSAPPPAS